MYADSPNVTPLPTLEGEVPQEEKGGLRLFRVLPGGASPSGEELAVAGLILAALGGMYAFRKGLRPGEGHVHVGASDVLAAVFVMTIAFGFIQTALAQPRFAESKLGKAFAWLYRG